MISRNGKSVSAVWYQGKQVKQAWFRGELYYSSSTPYSGFEAVLDQLDARGGVFRLLPPDDTEVFPNGFTTRDSHAHMLVEGDSSLTIVQAGREVLSLRVEGGTLSVASNGDRGRLNLAFSAPWPGGRHIVSTSTMVDWYGYRLKLFIDGVQVETATNGGAFNLSENLFVSGDFTVSSEGCLFWSVHVGEHAVDNAVTRIPFVADFVAPGSVSWRVADRGTDFRVPGGLVQAWAYSGGDGGDGGDNGHRDGSSGSPGSNGNGAQVPGFTLGMLPSLVIGAGGAGGVGGTSHWSQLRKGEPGAPGQPTTLTNFTTATATTRPTPYAWGSRYLEVLPGVGGSGGRQGSEDSDGDYRKGIPGGAGRPGGIIIARKW